MSHFSQLFVVFKFRITQARYHHGPQFNPHIICEKSKAWLNIAKPQPAPTGSLPYLSGATVFKLKLFMRHRLHLVCVWKKSLFVFATILPAQRQGEIWQKVSPNTAVTKTHNWDTTFGETGFEKGLGVKGGRGAFQIEKECGKPGTDIRLRNWK